MSQDNNNQALYQTLVGHAAIVIIPYYQVVQQLNIHKRGGFFQLFGHRYIFPAGLQVAAWVVMRHYQAGGAVEQGILQYNTYIGHRAGKSSLSYVFEADEATGLAKIEHVKRFVRQVAHQGYQYFRGILALGYRLPRQPGGHLPPAPQFQRCGYGYSPRLAYAFGLLQFFHAQPAQVV